MDEKKILEGIYTLQMSINDVREQLVEHKQDTQQQMNTMQQQMETTQQQIQTTQQQMSAGFKEIQLEMREGFQKVHERIDLVEATIRVINEDTLKTRAEIDHMKRIK